MEIFFGWIIFSFVVGFVGSGRNIGFWGAFLLSLLLSPVIGLIIALVSKDKEDQVYRKEVLDKLSESKTEDSQTNSISKELEKLKELRDNNSITDEEFQKLKSKIIDS